jgi:hypothetical protein
VFNADSVPLSPLPKLVSGGPLYHLLWRATNGDLRASVYARGESRLGQWGFNTEFGTVAELLGRVRKLTKLTAVLEQRLFCSISRDSVNRFEHDVHVLIRRGVEQKSSIHVQVLSNLVQKLLAKNNHKYSNVIRMISQLYKRRIGGAHYKELTFLFGLQGETSIRQDQKKLPRLHLGENSKCWDRAVGLYKDEQGRPLPIVNSGDGVRMTMKVSAVVDSGNEVELVGECWSADRRTWVTASVQVPKPREGKDEYGALQRYVRGVSAGE